MTTDLHLVFGTGPAGTAVAQALIDQGSTVRAVNRSGHASIDGVETIAGDATDAAFTEAVAVGASTIYFCLNAPTYNRWPEEFPPLQRGVLHAAVTSGARLVVLENLYMYGATVGPMTESTPVATTTAKGRTRADMSADLLNAHERGEAEIVIGRASDFVGPLVRNSALGTQVFAAALQGKRAQLVGRPGTSHSYSYVPDVGRNLVTLGAHDAAYGRAWHLPNPETLTTDQVLAKVYAALGTKPKIMAAKRPVLRALGLFNSDIRELLHTYYQFDAPFVVDDSAFRNAFPAQVSSWDDIIAATLAWYRSQTDSSALAR